MATITDFAAWLEQANPDDHEEVYALYRAVADEEEMGLYECSRNARGQLFVKANHTDDTLMIASASAKALFLQKMEEQYCDDPSDMESWYGYKRAMAKDD